MQPCAAHLALIQLSRKPGAGAACDYDDRQSSIQWQGRHFSHHAFANKSYSVPESVHEIEVNLSLGEEVSSIHEAGIIGI